MDFFCISHSFSLLTRLRLYNIYMRFFRTYICIYITNLCYTKLHSKLISFCPRFSAVFRFPFKNVDSLQKLQIIINIRHSPVKQCGPLVWAAGKKLSIAFYFFKWVVHAARNRLRALKCQYC